MAIMYVPNYFSFYGKHISRRSILHSLRLVLSKLLFIAKTMLAVVIFVEVVLFTNCFAHLNEPLGLTRYGYFINQF